MQQQSQNNKAEPGFCLLMGTPTGEQHSLALRLLQAVLIAHRVHTIDLGADLPVDTLASAVERYQPDALALSIHMSMTAPAAGRYLNALDQVLPADLPLWLVSYVKIMEKTAFLKI